MANSTSSLSPIHPCDDARLDKTLLSAINVFEYDVPVAWFVIQLLYIVVFFILSMYVFFEIKAWVKYQYQISVVYFHQNKKKEFKFVNVLSQYHYHLPKLIALFLSAFIRTIWLINPWYSWKNKDSNIFGSNPRLHNLNASVLLRLPQVFAFTIFFFQLKVWIATAQNSKKLRLSLNAHDKNSSCMDGTCNHIKSTGFLIDIALVILIVACVIHFVINAYSYIYLTLVLYFFTAYVIILCPCAIYYILRLQEMILKMRSLRKVGNTKFKNKKIKSAVRKMLRIKHAVYCMTIGGWVQIGAALLRIFFIDASCSISVDDRQDESVKMLIYVSLIHLTEVIYLVALFYTLYMARGRNISTKTKRVRIKPPKIANLNKLTACKTHIVNANAPNDSNNNITNVTNDDNIIIIDNDSDISCRSSSSDEDGESNTGQELTIVNPLQNTTT